MRCESDAKRCVRVKQITDTVSKFIWNAQHSPPTRLPQAHAVSRMLLLVAIMIHRANHISTAKKQLNYMSLKHYRDAANR
jgi:hypothetical protein